MYNCILGILLPGIQVAPIGSILSPRITMNNRESIKK